MLPNPCIFVVGRKTNKLWLSRLWHWGCMVGDLLWSQGLVWIRKTWDFDRFDRRFGWFWFMLPLVADMLRAHVPKSGMVDKSRIWQACFSQVVFVPERSCTCLFFRCLCFQWTWYYDSVLPYLHLILPMRPGSKTPGNHCVTSILQHCIWMHLAQVTMVDLMQQHVDGAKKLADEAGLEKAPKILYISIHVSEETNGQSR